MRRYNRLVTQATYIAGNINIVNITNVTNVSYARPLHIQSQHTWGRSKHKKPPKLLRFCASGGLLDRDVAYRMNEGEMLTELSKVAAYGFKGMASSLKGIGDGIVGMLCSLF